MAFPSLYILRHGQTVWNAEQRLQGALDSPLTDLGRTQALAQHALLKTCDLDGYQALCSPQGRAFHTASISLEGLVPAIHTDTRLAEIGLGTWQGKRLRDIAGDRVFDGTEESALDIYERAPGGEGFAALRARCAGFLSDVRGPSVLVTHGVTSRMLRLLLMGRDTSEIGLLPGGQGVVYRVENGIQTRLHIGA